jgi:DNA uptake protein ComE-like DNA-binding protein
MLSAKKVFSTVSVGIALALILLSVPAVAQTGKVNLSVATVEQVAKVPGMTPELAKAIVDYKAVNGLTKATSGPPQRAPTTRKRQYCESTKKTTRVSL